MMELTGLPEVSAPLPWHADDWTQLNRQMDSGQLPHALLLAGPQYTGKSRLALALARLLLCQQPQGGLNCGKCHACALSAGGSHGDFRWLQPEEKSRVIKIDQVRAVVDFANKTAGLGQRKVMVLAPADSMNSNAANALLKSLEEPASDTYLILVCHRLHGVPATIRSRCQMPKLAQPSKDQCLTWLDHATGERGQSAQLLELAQGLPLLAEQLYRDSSADRAGAVRAGLDGLLSARLSVPEVVALLADTAPEDLLAQLAARLQASVLALPAQNLRGAQGRAFFLLLDEVARLQRAVGAGANPNRQLMVEALLGRVQRQLGEAHSGGSIGAQEARV